MGLLKVIFALVVGFFLDRFIKKYAKSNKNKSIVKYLKPYIDNSCNIILIAVLAVMLLL